MLSAPLGGCGAGSAGSTTSPIARSQIVAPSGSVRWDAGPAAAVWGPSLRPGSPRGVLLLIHGGGWRGFNAQAVSQAVAVAVPLRKLGFDTLVVDYRAGAQGLTDVQAFYRRARERTHRRLDVCAFGTSAGGNLALLLAEREPHLRCVVDIAGPTDLPALRALPASYQLAVQAFGQDRLEEFSPVRHASTLRARTLLVYADRDPIVPVAQGREMARFDPSARLITLAPGGATFVHNSVSYAARGDGVNAAARRAVQVAEVQFLVQSVR